MNKSLEKTLHRILPTANEIPRELMELANSLLNQSRNRISSLNSAEEIARETVCAHIACERMKLKLGLPKIEAVPPIRPALYSKLYAHFDSVLSSSSASSRSNPSTPSKNRTLAAAPGTFSKTQQTPSKRGGALSQFIPATTRKQKQPSDDYIDTIQEMCESLELPEAIPHVSRAYNNLALSFKHGPLASHPVTLIGALFMVISVRMRGIDDDDDDETSEKEGNLTDKYRALRDEVFETLGNGLKGVKKDKFDKFVAEELMHEDVLEMAWYQDVPEKGHVGEGDEEEEDEEDNDGEAMEVDQGGSKKASERRGKAGKRSLVIVGKEISPPVKKKKMEAAGVGTMMQDRVDYLSAKRRKNYAEWKDNILQKMATIQAA